MANSEHLEILHKGVQVWNDWRLENPSIKPNFERAVLNDFNFSNYVLTDANFFRAEMRESRFRGAALQGSQLFNADLLRANFNFAQLNQANLQSAALNGASFRHAVLNGANLAYSDITNVNFTYAYLDGTDFSDAQLGGTTFGRNDLSNIKGAEAVRPVAASAVGIETIFLSNGEAAEAFILRCGISKEFIRHVKSFAYQAIEFYSCFISHSSKDEKFAQRLYNDLLNCGVTCLYAPENLKIGDKFRHWTDESILMSDKLLLILSENSIASQWVENEVEAAMEREREKGRNATMLFPIKLDDAIDSEKNGWAADVRRTRHIGDFRAWNNNEEYQKAFGRLLRDLRAAEE